MADKKRVIDDQGPGSASRTLWAGALTASREGADMAATNPEASNLFDVARPVPPRVEASVDGFPAPTGVMPGATEFNEEEATPEEQAQYDQFVNKALDFMGKNPEQLLATLNNKDKPAYESVGELAFQMGTNINAQAKAAGQQLSPEVLQNAGAELIEHLMALGDAGGIFPFKQSSDDYDQTMSMALLHAGKLVTEQFMKSPQYNQDVQDQAGNFFAQQVAGEVQRGEVDPSFHENLAREKAAGTKRITQGR